MTMNEISTIFWNDRNGKLHITEPTCTFEVLEIIPNVSCCHKARKLISGKYDRFGMMVRNYNGIMHVVITGDYAINPKGFMQ